MIKNRVLRVIFDTDRIIVVLFTMVLLTVLGQLLPNIYYKYFDKTNYITVKQPVPVDAKEYRPGDTILLLLERTSQLDIALDGQYELALVRATDRYEPIAEQNTRGVVTMGRRIIIYKFQIPDDAPTGKYFIRGVYPYSFKGRDISYPFTSDFFSIL